MIDQDSVDIARAIMNSLYEKGDKDMARGAQEVWRELVRARTEEQEKQKKSA